MSRSYKGICEQCPFKKCHVYEFVIEKLVMDTIDMCLDCKQARMENGEQTRLDESCHCVAPEFVNQLYTRPLCQICKKYKFSDM